MKLQLSMLVCALALAGCADHAARERLGITDATVLKTGIGASQDEAAGAANSQWVTTYAPIVSSSAALASLQKRLDEVPADKNSYFHAKAQCWLNAGQQTRQNRDHWGFVEEAIGQAAMITMSLENDTPLSAANPALRTVSTVRPDLWKIVNTIKADPVLAQCPRAQQPLACAEVGLMQAGHDAWIRSFSKAEKRLPEVQDNLRKSAETALQCKQAMQTSAAAPALGEQSASAPRIITLRADSLFRFNGGDDAAILPAGKRQLDAVADGLKNAPALRELTITGYTDRLGAKAYNQSLSLKRAQTVQKYLRARGVTLPMTARGQGSTNQLADCRQTKRDELLRCLAPNRRVEIEIVVGAS
ncbi:outer membrane protein OmpA-like peptidoglycan-associated protein [Paraburkholderia terricola]|jgi:outer membrane protein OmpA-like peptidoglycan-associated protein|uniref:OmpA family protein n=1 Tax=Paraburkholderia terricola TaxID=169427 RepID=A0A1M6UWT5_9BURK|nr:MULTISPECIES: OmpA family protein [Paraburkholderia]MDR6446937.1 outer membrane protein OmpA-like peptidoglycan-associated protein [Paraburkholderia terricola]MDR6492661.1 outer membrane protein OmpA-like peptidoglycan-associated protein [Paraburkholderia terricola]SDO25561.1 OmpA family protein [Paraburkholderia sediminicola]SHK73621.1 OmpA family protein [Paraburkholderia terricola]